jgi:hypothetical protein
MSSARLNPHSEFCVAAGGYDRFTPRPLGQTLVSQTLLRSSEHELAWRQKLLLVSTLFIDDLSQREKH